MGLMREGMFTGDYSLSPKVYKKLSDTEYYYLSSVVTHPDERGKGLAESMVVYSLNNLQNYCQDLDVITIAITAGGKRLADKVGFKTTGYVEGRYIMHLKTE